MFKWRAEHVRKVRPVPRIGPWKSIRLWVRILDENNTNDGDNYDNTNNNNNNDNNSNDDNNNVKKKSKNKE